VLAGRLSEDQDARVALLEAGGPDTADEIHTPAAFPAVFKSSLDWDLLGEPEPALGGRRLYLPRGRVIGGSSSINAMIYIRGNRADYDEWAAMGFEGWGYDDVLPYFKRAEDNERGENAFHGAGGPLSVSESRSMHPLVDTMIEAAQQAGHEHNPDFNGARQEGVGRFQLTQRGGLRCSCADAYLNPARSRSNLDVIPNAMVTRLLFEGDRAVGVELSRGGELEGLRADEERARTLAEAARAWRVEGRLDHPCRRRPEVPARADDGARIGSRPGGCACVRRRRSFEPLIRRHHAELRNPDVHPAGARVDLGAGEVDRFPKHGVAGHAPLESVEQPRGQVLPLPFLIIIVRDADADGEGMVGLVDPGGHAPAARAAPALAGDPLNDIAHQGMQLAESRPGAISPEAAHGRTSSRAGCATEVYVDPFGRV
jgi:hypothetical protein